MLPRIRQVSRHYSNNCYSHLRNSHERISQKRSDKMFNLPCKGVDFLLITRRTTKHRPLLVWKAECEFQLSPLYSAVIYHPSRLVQTQRKWSVSATGRGEGGWSDPQHVNLDLFYESRPPWKMKCSCCERKQWSGTHVITLTPWRGSTGIHPQAMAPMCPLGLANLPISEVIFIYSQAPSN